jgi:hypothetical protein
VLLLIVSFESLISSWHNDQGYIILLIIDLNMTLVLINERFINIYIF